MSVPDDPAPATLAGIRAIEQAATPGPWHLEWDSCDCGDGYGCSHGSWPHAIRNSRADTEPRQDGKQRDWDYKHTEISELGGADAEFIVTARTVMPLLLAAVDALTGALERHQQWFTDKNGTRICGGCLEPVPCKDTDVIGRALAGTGKEGSEDG